GHRIQILLLLRSQPIEADEKEVLVEVPGDEIGGTRYVTRRDRGTHRNVPNVVAPLLQEVRITLGSTDDLLQRMRHEVDTHFLGGDRYRGLSIGLVERPDLRKLEESLGIGLRIPGEPGQLWETCADKHDGQVELRRSMDRGDERGQLHPGEVL